MTFDPGKTPGSFAGPPPGAPHEVTLPGSEQPTAEQVAQARANERDLPVYAPKPMTVEQQAAYLGKTVEEIQQLRLVQVESIRTITAPAVPQLVGPDGQPISSVPVPVVAAPAGPMRRRIANAPAAPPTPIEQVQVVAGVPTVATPAEQQAPAAVLDTPAPPSSLAAAAQQVHPRGADSRPSVDEPYYPAGSATDTPSRGMPTAIADKGKQITGGFGDVGEAQYFPMDGLELGRVALKLLAELQARIPNDLRFSMALTYPRVRLRAVVEVECYAQDGSFMVEKIMVPSHEKTPIDVARRHGDRCCFAVIEERIEMDDEGNSVTPPNAMRMEIGAQIPRKHAVPLPGGVGRLLVDVDSDVAR